MSSSPTAEPPRSVAADEGRRQPVVADADPAEPVVVGRVGRAHGITGELSVAPLTDSPRLRFAPDAVLLARLPTGSARELTVVSVRPHADRLLVRFAGVADRTTAQAVAGATLLARPAPAEAPPDPEEFYDHQLVGAAALGPGGAALGTVTAVLHHGAQDLLVVTPAAGSEVLVPFVAAIVVAVDPVARTLTLDPPGGLFP